MAAEPVEGPLSGTDRRRAYSINAAVTTNVPDRLDEPAVCRNPITDDPATISRRYPPN